jgi:uncharacterized protein YjiS (DUF1127 family)
MTRSASMTIINPGIALVTRFTRQLVTFAKAFKDRREVMNLAEFDDRMLEDIGLTRSDVSSALAEPLRYSPSWVLIRRAEERARIDKACDPVRKARPVVPFARQVV